MPQTTTTPGFNMRIVFLGTPDFAVASLRILLENGYDIPAVVTAPDKPGGRKGMLQSAVKLFALEHNIPVLQPVKLKEPEFLDTLRSLKADLQVVVAFRMLPEVVWNMPPLGTMNLHGSLLPRYRGAAPINWAIINGEKETGVTTFLLRHEIDTGDVLARETITIGENETAGELHDRMMDVGARLVLQSVKALEAGTAKPAPQLETEVTYAPKIHTDTCKIDFSRSNEDVHNFIRGLSPHPGAWTVVQDKVLKIYRTEKTDGDGLKNKPGVFLVENARHILVGTGSGYLRVLELQLEGKKRMNDRDFLNGHPAFFDAGYR
jgi:methionyl-tRNA formyltransferase